MINIEVVSKQAQNRKQQKSKAASTNQWLSSKASRYNFSPNVLDIAKLSHPASIG